MAYTSMKTWAFGAILPANELNTYMRDNIEYLKGVVDSLSFSGVQLGRPATQSLATGTPENIIWTDQAFDYGSWWASGTTMTVPASAIPAGYTTIAVLVFGRLQYASNATGVRRVRVLKNGSSFGSRTYAALGGGDFTDVDITELVIASAGDTITVEGYQTSGGNLNVQESNISVLRYAPNT